MAQNQRKPIELQKATRSLHRSKAEIEAREKSEVAPATDEIRAPKHLTKAQKAEFNKLAKQLLKIKIMGETDCDALARYVVARDLYLSALDAVQKQEELKPDDDDLESMASWVKVLEPLDRRLERYSNQCCTLARDLGLTIASRCRLVVPQAEEPEKKNKFAKFQEVENG